MAHNFIAVSHELAAIAGGFRKIYQRFLLIITEREASNVLNANPLH